MAIDTSGINSTTTIDSRALLALIDASRALNEDLDPDQLYEQIAAHATNVLAAESASVLLYETSAETLVFRVALGPAGSTLVGERINAKDGIAGQVLRTGKPAKVNDARTHPNFLPDIDRKTHTRTRSLIAAPMTDRDFTVGVLEVLNPLHKDVFNDQDLELLRVFANLAAIASRNAQRFEQVRKENQGLKRQLPRVDIIGQAPAFREALDLCERVAGADSTVLLQGETGTGKEMAARFIHSRSPRAARPLIAMNCAALPENLLESELFGHEKGAFTGASERRLGRFELAEGGTLFLDEISEMSFNIQAKLLRVLQEKEFTRVGGAKTIHSNVRIIAACNRDLKSEIEVGNFREDLYYRLNVFPIILPPLRERQGDVALLVQWFLQEISQQLGKPTPSVTDEAMQQMRDYAWPGNIRELRNVVERCILLADDRIQPSHLPQEIRQSARDAEAHDAPIGQSKLAAQERQMLVEALESTGYNQSAAARKLGITRDHVRYRIKKYNIQIK